MCVAGFICVAYLICDAYSSYVTSVLPVCRGAINTDPRDAVTRNDDHSLLDVAALVPRVCLLVGQPGVHLLDHG